MKQVDREVKSWEPRIFSGEVNISALETSLEFIELPMGAQWEPSFQKMMSKNPSACKFTPRHTPKRTAPRVKQ